MDCRDHLSRPSDSATRACGFWQRFRPEPPIAGRSRCLFREEELLAWEDATGLEVVELPRGGRVVRPGTLDVRSVARLQAFYAQLGIDYPVQRTFHRGEATSIGRGFTIRWLRDRWPMNAEGRSTQTARAGAVELSHHATFVFTKPPTNPTLRLILVLRYTSHSSCCAALYFRQSRGQPEVGSDSRNPDNQGDLRPVHESGAAIHGNTLTITGTLPPPTQWRMVTHHMPSANHVGWSATATLTLTKNGPGYGDLLPGYKSVGEPIIRHRDGKAIPPARGF